MLRVSLLGGIVVEHGGRSGRPVPVTKTLQSLLAFLLLQRHRGHTREVLSGLFWGDQNEERARGCLNTALWRLRRALEPPGVARGTYLVNSSQGDIRFNCASPYWLDVEALERAAAPIAGVVGCEAEPALVRDLEAAVELYRGDLLEGVYDDWALSERDRIRTLYLESLGYLVRHHAAQGAHDRGLAYGRAILRCDPLREEIHREMIRGYIATGQRGLARQQYETCREVLMSELGAEPLAETQALYAQIVTLRPLPTGRRPSAPQVPVAFAEALRQALRGIAQAHTHLEAAVRLLDAERPASRARPGEQRVTRG